MRDERKRERDEFRWLIERQIPHLRRYAFALTRERETADDMVQDSLERALRKRHLWSRRGTLRSWLFRILHRRCADHFRARRHPMVAAEPEMIDKAVSQPPSQEARVDCGRVVGALGRLPHEQRAVVLLVALEGLTYDEVAEITGTPIGTVRSRLSRARETLRQFRDSYPQGSRSEDRGPVGKLRMVK